MRREAGSKPQRDSLTDGDHTAHSSKLYSIMAELGWLGLAMPEAYGGSGRGMVDLMLFSRRVWLCD